MAGDRAQQRRAVLDLRHDLDLVLAKQRHQPFAQQREVLGDHYPQGSLTSSSVPTSAALCTARLPSSASTRARSPASPEPSRASAPPQPSSPTITASARGSSRSTTQLCRARACLAVFVSASAITKYAA